MQNMKDEDTSASLVRDLLKDRRAERRWKNIRFVAWFLLITFVSISSFRLFVPSSTVASLNTKGKYVALIRLDGMIAPGRSFSAEETIPILHDAFTDKNALGIILDIDSPGGTPVQSSIIHDAIVALKKKYHKKVVIVGEDLLTSGAYFVAVAADKIYVNPNTITGSIGVIMKGFGFVDLLKKIGVERRVYTIGSDKDRLDPFLPQNPEDLKKIQTVMSEIHNNFAQAVLVGRKSKLQGNPDELFSGDFWSGQTALKLGLVDGLGNLMDVMQKEFNTENFREYGNTPNLLRLFGGQVGSTLDAVLNGNVY